MYRQYENPYKLQKRLEDVERQISDERARGTDLEDLINLYQERDELKERINFAWQDDEAEAMGWE